MQYFLGVSLNKPIFTSIRYDDTNMIDIYFGGIKFTTIPNNKNSLLFKSTIAMLLNANVRIRQVQNAFNISFETARKYRDAFNNFSDDDEQINNALKNPGRIPYKTNNEINDYIITQAAVQRKIGKHGYIKRTVEDIKEKFGITLSREAIRLALNKKKTSFVDNNETNQIDTKIVNIENSKSDDKVQNIVLGNNNPMKFRNNYAGIFLLSPFFSLVFNDFPSLMSSDKKYSLKTLFIWWMYGIVLGATNMEKLRYFNIEDFEFVSGYEKFPCVETLRDQLYKLSICKETAASTIILKKNIDYFIEESTDYYLDGHSEEYTGKSKILKVWSTIKNRVYKGIIDYFVHDGAGNPIFSLLSDGFYDFREVILKLLSKIKSMRPNKKITLIYDRGGFSIDLMQEISKVKDQFFITWQKGFKEEEAETIIFNGHIKMEFPYNDLGKFKSYDVYFGEDEWECKGFKCRRIVFQRESEKKGIYYQSILTNDKKEDAGIVVKKMLNRPLQELDFKKQKGRFGLDELTSYTKISYGMLNDKDVNKKAKNKDHEKKLYEIQKLKKQMNKLLEKIGLKFYKQLDLKRKAKDFNEKNKIIIEQIIEKDNQIKKLKKELKLIPEEVSKLKKCIDEGYIELDLRAKRIMGILKMTARNIFEKGAKDFLNVYTNLRDYQKVFYKLVNSAGEIEINDKVMYIKLDSFGHKAFKEKCNEYFEKMNQKAIKTIDGKYVLQFKPFS